MYFEISVISQWISYFCAFLSLFIYNEIVDVVVIHTRRVIMHSQVRLSLKQRKRIGNLINSVSVYQGMVTRDIREGKDVKDTMKWHDDAVEELRQLLGVLVTSKYTEKEQKEPK